MGVKKDSGVELPENVQQTLNMWLAVFALVWSAVYGWHAFVRGSRVPILEYMDIAVHELGHIVFQPFGSLVSLIMGSGSQVLFPFVVGLVFLARKRDPIRAGICWAWCGAAAADAATYIYDAPRGELALIGFGGGTNGSHMLGDWSRILGPQYFDKLYLADRLAADVRSAGMLIWFAAVGLVLFDLVNGYMRSHGSSFPRRFLKRQPSGSTLAPVSDSDMWRA